MKRVNIISWSCGLILSMTFYSSCDHSKTNEINKKDNMNQVTNQQDSTSIQEVHDFLKKCGTYYLATAEGDQPRVRPFGTINIFEGKLYIQTGKIKNVSKQIGLNPRIEICAFDGQQQWIRVQAIAIEDDRREAKQSMLDAYPDLQSMYSADDDNTQTLFLKDVTATVSSFSGEPKVIKF
jgi:uncharacterized pyridoxamine 5'-phosphate oxidase family protein